MVRHYIFDELANLLAKMGPQKVLAFRTSNRSQERLNFLLEKNKSNAGLDSSEIKEMEDFMLVEHIVSLAKARALKSIAQKAEA